MGVYPLQIERFGSVKDPGTFLLPYTVIDLSSEPDLLPFTVQQGDGSFYGAKGALSRSRPLDRCPYPCPGRFLLWATK